MKNREQSTENIGRGTEGKNRDQRIENRRKVTGDRVQRRDDRGQGTIDKGGRDDRGQRTGDMGQRAGNKEHSTKDRGKMTDNR